MKTLVEFVMHAAMSLHAREVLRRILLSPSTHEAYWRVLTVLDMMDIPWDEQHWLDHRHAHQDRPFLEVLVEYANLRLDVEVGKRVASFAERPSAPFAPRSPMIGS